MAEVKQVTINGETYNIAQAMAKQQKTLLTLVGAICAGNSASSQIEEINAEFLKGMLLIVGEDTLDKISNIVLPRIFKNGEESPVNIESFKGGMNTYLSLIAEGVKANLDDFFIWLNSANKQTNESNKKNVKAL